MNWKDFLTGIFCVGAMIVTIGLAFLIGLDEGRDMQMFSNSKALNNCNEIIMGE